MTNEELVRAVLEKVGGKDNVVTATNCMTRLRLEVREDAKIDEAGLKGIEGVMGIVHDRTNKVEVVVGPGKCRKCADICRDMGIPASSDNANDWQANKAAVKANQKQSPIKGMLKTFGDIFVPLIPGVVAAGHAQLGRELLLECGVQPAGSGQLCIPGLSAGMGWLPCC